MKEFLLNKKWVGLLSVLIISVLFAVYQTNMVAKVYNEAEPVIAGEAGHFLPVAFQKGEIVFPQNTVIERTYGSAQNPYKIVLNTEVENLDISNLATGVYFTRNKIYYADTSKGETKIQSLEKFPDMEITRKDFNDMLEHVGNWLQPVLFLTVFVFAALYMSLIALFGTMIMHWFFKKTYNTAFALTLRVNLLTAAVLFLIGIVVDVNFGFFVTLLIMGACNYLVNIKSEDKSQKMS